MDIYVSPRGRANLVVGVFVVYILVEILLVAATLEELSLLQRITDGGAFTIEELIASDDRLASLGLLYVLVFVLLTVVFLVWLYRIRINEGDLGISGTRFSNGWSVWVWFIPIMNLFRPYQIMKEAWQASDPDAIPDGWMQSAISPLLGWWWALWLVGGYASNVSARIFFGADDLESYITSDRLDLVSSALLIPSALLAIMIVRGISARQDMRYRRMQELPSNLLS